MRACVHIAAMTLALAGCRANPGFILFDEGNGEDREGDSESEGLSTGTSSDESAGANICEPQVQEPNNACKPWEALPLTLLDGFNPANTPLLANVPCEQVTQLLVKRAGDSLQQCDNSCDEPCEGPSMSVDGAASVADIKPLLPAEGTCSVLWHRGRPNPDSESQTLCLTSGFALFDDDPEQRLRVAVAFNTPDPDPFAGVPGSPFSVTLNKEGVVGEEFCRPMERSACDPDNDVDVEEVKREVLDFRFGECLVPSSQGQIVRDIQLGGERHILENHSAYRCIDGGLTVYRWWLRRVF